MKQLSWTFAVAAFAAAFTVTAAAQQVVGTGQIVAPGSDVTLTGCVVKGEGGFVLSQIDEELKLEMSVTTPGTTAAPAPAKTVTSVPRILYWLDDDDDLLEKHAGHRVEIKGEIEGDIDAGEIEIEREQGMIELEIEAKGEKVTVKLPDTAATNATAVATTGTLVTDSPKEVPFKVRKLDVESVKMLSASCR